MAKKTRLTAYDTTHAVPINVDSETKLNKNIDQAGNDLMQPDDDSPVETSKNLNPQPNLVSECGGALRLAREQSGLTIQDIASRLKISPKQIVAIESDQYDALPEPTIVRGFIRNYAKLLKIDAQPLLEAYKLIVPDKSPYAFAVKPASTMKVSSYEKPKMGRYIWAGFALLVGLAAWLFYQHYVQKPSPTAPSVPVETIEQLPQPALPAAERLELNTPTIDGIEQQTLPIAPAKESSSSESGASESGASVSGASESGASESGASVIQPNDNNEVSSTSSILPSTVSPPTNLPPATSNALPSGSLQLTPSVNELSGLSNAVTANALPANNEVIASTSLEFNAIQESWVSITDKNGRKIFNKIIFANSRQSIEVTPPVNVLVGNAAGLSMSSNNQPIDLGPHTRSNVARVRLD